MPIMNRLAKKHNEYLMDLERYNTQLAKNTAEVTALTKELSAKRELVNAYFSIRLKEKEQMYFMANKVLDQAIKTGNVEMAELAVKQIKIIKSEHRS